MNNLLIIDGFTIFGWPIKFYGILMSIAFIIGVIYVAKMAPKKGFDGSIAFDLVLIAFPTAILGARLNYVLFTLDRGWTFVSILQIWNGGLMIYGGVLFAAVAIAIYCKIKKYSILKVFDLIAPALILGQAIGRWGNFFNQEAYGTLVTENGLQWFPFSVWIDKSHFTEEAKTQLVGAYGTSMVDGAWFNATFFYESFWCACGFVLLHLLSKRTNKTGLITATYLAYYGFERFFVEMIRTDSLYLGPIKISVLISGIIFLVGASYLIYLLIKHKKSGLETEKTDKNTSKEKEVLRCRSHRENHT